MPTTSAIVARRTVLQLSFGAAPMALIGSAALGKEGAAAPPDVNRKFYADGRVYPFPGNTIICHVAQQGPESATFDALLDVYRDAPSHSFMRKFALLPPSSYHMTVLGGANDRPRVAKSWPADLAQDLPMGQCTEILRERLARANIECDLPIRMRVDPVQRPANGQALTILLLPIDAGEETKLRKLRKQIAEATSLPLQEPDNYRFHISIGYSIAWLTPSEMSSLTSIFSDWARHVQERSPVISLGAPEFCRFEDMYAYHRLLYLSRRAETIECPKVN